MRTVVHSLRKARTTLWLSVLVLLVACAPAELEPSFGGGPTAEGTATSESPLATQQLLPTPFPSPTLVPPPITPSATAVVEDPAPPTTTAAGQRQNPFVTPTPVPPLPGLVYNLAGQLWLVGDDWQSAQLAAEPGDVLSADGERSLRVVDNDIWMIALSTGQRFNLTGNSGRVHCCPQFWPAQPDTIIAGSWSAVDDLGPSTGHLSAAKFDLSEYQVLDEEHLSNANYAPGPDGRTIAYDRGGSAWLFDRKDGPRPLDPAEYGLSNIARIAGPSWSPDGRQLAWTVAVTDPEWRIAVAVFDLEAKAAKLFHPYQNVGRGGWFLPPEWSPDGRWLAFVAEDADPEQFGVWVVEVDSGTEVFIGAGIHPTWSPDGRWLLTNAMNPDQASPQLVETGSWYPLQMYLPPGALVVDWLP